MKIFTTKDIQLASYLTLINITIKEIRKNNNILIWTFQFDSEIQSENIINNFYSGVATAPVIKIFEVYKRLKSLIKNYEYEKGNF